MLARNGRQLASGCSNGTSAVERRFFDVLYRWSTVGCVAGSGVGLRRNSTKTPSPSPIPAKEQTPDELHSQAVREAFRILPNPVVVLTTTASTTPGAAAWTSPDVETDPDPSLYRGMTLSSFTSLSMSPQPLVTFNIGYPSRTLNALTETRHFLVHILRANQEGALIARAFTKGNVIQETEANEEHSAEGEEPPTIKNPSPKTLTPFELARQQDPGVSVRSHIVQSPINNDQILRLPRITRSGFVHQVLHCRVLGEGDRQGGGLIRIGDHVLVIAKVVEVLEMAGIDGKRPKNVTGLAYRAGEFVSTNGARIPMMVEGVVREGKDGGGAELESEGEKGEVVDDVGEGGEESAENGGENIVKDSDR